MGILVIYIFMVTAFWAFPEDLVDNQDYYPDGDDDGADDDGGEEGGGGRTMCTSMVSCYAVFLVNGLLTGGGIGEFISAELGNAPPLAAKRTLSRYAFDLAFFVVVTIGLLNLCVTLRARHTTLCPSCSGFSRSFPLATFVSPSGGCLPGSLA